MRDKYGVSQDKYCFPGTDTLINLLDIRDPHTLSEAEFTPQRYRSYTPKYLELFNFNLEHLQFLHHHLFQDVYTWAGEVRDSDIYKGNSRFCTCA